MKKFVFLFALMFAATFSFAQQKAIVSSLQAFNEAKADNSFTFVLSEKITEERIAELSDYYTRYFTTTFDAQKNAMHIQLNEQESVAKNIMRRLFSGIGIDEVLVEGKAISTDVFFADYVLQAD